MREERKIDDEAAQEGWGQHFKAETTQINVLYFPNGPHCTAKPSTKCHNTQTSKLQKHLKYKH